jgi:hypothetical protein
MTREEIFGRLKRIISEETNIPENEILWDTEFAEIENGRLGATGCQCKRNAP